MSRSEYQRQWYVDNRERMRDLARQWYLNNREKILADRKLKYNPELKRAQDMRRKYNLSVSEYDHLLARGCNICGNKASEIDHDHNTGVVRGALCSLCNKGLGFFRDNPGLLKAAQDYLDAS